MYLCMMSVKLSTNILHTMRSIRRKPHCMLVAYFVRSFQLLVHTVTTGVAVEEVVFSSHTAYPTLVTMELVLFCIIKQTALQTRICTKFYFALLTLFGHL